MSHEIHTISKKSMPNFVHQYLEQFPENFSYQGKVSLLEQPLITIVGTRKPSAYGISLVEYLLQQLSNYNIITVSGLAYGVDALVHQQSLINNIPTIAIPGSGIQEDIIYPRGNFGLSREIINNNGLILSPFNTTDHAQKYFFPVRNKLMAAISHAVIVIEAQEKSGSLITAHCALEYGKPLYVFPGSYFSPLSRGCHQLVSEGANIFTSLDMFVEDLGLVPKNSSTLFSELESEHKDTSLNSDDIFSVPQTLTQLCEHFKKSPPDMLAELTLLELDGKITQVGGRYQKSHQ